MDRADQEVTSAGRRTNVVVPRTATPPQDRAGHRVRLGVRRVRAGPNLALLKTPQPRSEPQCARFSAGPALLSRAGRLAVSANICIRLLSRKSVRISRRAQDWS